MESDIQAVKAQYMAAAAEILTGVYQEYKDKGILAIYFWGSITRDDWDPRISDIDSLAIITPDIDLSTRKALNERVKASFPYEIYKFGMQFIGVDELNGSEPYTVLGNVQPPGYLLLRFSDWVHVVGQGYKRADFAVENFTPTQAHDQQLAQAFRALKILNGELPMDENRASGMRSMAEDAIKGAIGALYWGAVAKGYSGRLNYNEVPNMVSEDHKALAKKLVNIRQTSAWTPEAILPLRREIEALS